MHPDDLRALEEASALATTSIKAYFAAPADEQEPHGARPTGR